jgi:hypothetical protein
VHSSTDNNGSGDPRIVALDISALGPFASATQLTIDAQTDTVQGPAENPIPLAPRMQVTLGGYGVTFVTLIPLPAAAHDAPRSYNGERVWSRPPSTRSGIERAGGR